MLTLGATACGDDIALLEVRPRALLCTSEDSPEATCNSPIELGELPLDIMSNVDLWLINRGSGPLEISSIMGSTSELVVGTFTPTVAAGGTVPLRVELTPQDLGPDRADLILTSNDPESPLTVPFQWTGIPKPVPRIELCSQAMSSNCGTDITVSFGKVRRSQRESHTVIVANRGTAELTISGVSVEGATTLPNEIVVRTSTRPAVLPVGAEAPLVFVYTPLDKGDDRVEFVLSTDDPQTPRASIVLEGSSSANEPPTARVSVGPGGVRSATVTVGQNVRLDGSGSSDPEADPLVHRWMLVPPQGSMAALDNRRAAVPVFEADVAGDYVATLVVVDSLGQMSAEERVHVHARPAARLRVRTRWSSGIDVDLHLLEDGADPFSNRDCYFGNPHAQFGAPGVVDDDAYLTRDSTVAPGREEIYMVQPAAGSYGIYAHYFAETGAPTADVTVEVVIDDAAPVVAQEMRTLDACELWHVGDIRFPDATFTPATAEPTLDCR